MLGAGHFHHDLVLQGLRVNKFAALCFKPLSPENAHGLRIASDVGLCPDRVPFGEVKRAGRAATEPSPESDPAAPQFRMLQETLAQVFPGIIVSPNLLSGGTDTKHYQHLTKNVYRFLPYRAKEDDFERFHGTNERVAVDNYGEMIRFYAQLIRNGSGVRSSP